MKRNGKWWWREVLSFSKIGLHFRLRLLDNYFYNCYFITMDLFVTIVVRCRICFQTHTHTHTHTQKKIKEKEFFSFSIDVNAGLGHGHHLGMGSHLVFPFHMKWNEIKFPDFHRPHVASALVLFIFNSALSFSVRFGSFTLCHFLSFNLYDAMKATSKLILLLVVWCDGFL